jgi:hypothetical protein
MAYTVASPGPPPQPPEPEVARFDDQGRPTPQQIQYERRLLAWQRALLGWLEGMAGNVPGTLVQGAWTPTLAGATTPGAHTYATRLGAFIRIENFVVVYARIVLSAKDAAMAGNVHITGLPYAQAAVAGLDTMVPVIGGNITLSNTNAALVAFIPQGQTYIALADQRSANPVTALPASGIASNSSIIVSGFYGAAPL